ncbi:hypothetical protein [Streptomyces sp. NPDC088925]
MTSDIRMIAGCLRSDPQWVAPEVLDEIADMWDLRALAVADDADGTP